MMMMVMTLRCSTFDVLLKRRIVLLCSRQISRLEIMGELVEGLGDRTVALRR